jgi:hypothetical protein
MKWVTAFALAGILAAQDQDRIPDLVKKLGDPEFAVREEAKAELAKIGAPALKALQEALQSPDAEVAESARSLIESIRRSQVVQGAIKGTRVTLQVKETPLAEAARTLGTAAGLQIRVPDSIADKPVTADFAGVELLRALDALARAAGAAYRFDGTAAVVFSEGGYVERPVAYSGPFKFTLNRVRSSIDNDFRKRAVDVDLTIAVESEPTARAIEPEIRIVRAVDAEGKKFDGQEEVEPVGRSVGEMNINGMRIRVVDGKVQVINPGGAAGDEGRTVSLRELPLSGGKLQSVLCAASFTVASEARRGVKFDRPAVGAVQQAGDLEAAIVGMDDQKIEFSLRLKSGARAGPDLFDPKSFSIAAGGADHEARLFDEDRGDRDAVRRLRRLQRGLPEGETRFAVAIPTEARGKPIDAVRFALKEVVEHRVEFEFRDLELK